MFIVICERSRDHIVVSCTLMNTCKNMILLPCGLTVFVFVRYSNQVPSVADACEIVFGSVLDLSNYGYSFHTCCELIVISQLILRIGCFCSYLLQ